LKFWW